MSDSPQLSANGDSSLPAPPQPTNATQTLGPVQHDPSDAPPPALAAEIDALLIDPPEWFVAEASDAKMLALDPHNQRGRNPKPMKLAWHWECCIVGPAGSPYGGQTYRVAVRFPVGYPLYPPRLQMLSIVYHADIELRDPYEGQLEDAFYEALERRAHGSDSATAAPAKKAPSLRFRVGERVECNVGTWVAGRVVRLWYRETQWQMGRRAPYQVRLDDGRLVFAPFDTDRLIRRPQGEDEAAASTSDRDASDGVKAPAEASAGRSGETSEAAESSASESPSEAEGEGAGTEAVQSRGAADTEPSPALNDAVESKLTDDPASRANGDLASQPAGEDGRDQIRYRLQPALELLLDSLRGPLDPADEEASAMWTAMAERHAEELETEHKYRDICLHPQLFDLSVGPQRAWFVDSFYDACTAPEGAARDAAVRSICNEVAAGVFTVDMLSPSFCSMLLDELQHYEGSGMPVVRPNSMNNYGVVLNSIGLERMMDLLQRDFVRPLVRVLFPVEGSRVDHHHSFMVQYKAGEDLGLDMHTDACDVTLNVCLGKEFVGAGLTLCGLRGAPADAERKFQYRHTHVRGQAVIHLGHHRHGADDIESGERYNLIMWSKNSTYRLTRDFMSKYSLPPSSDRDPPDMVCLSYTHDDDYETYKAYPEGKRPRRDAGG